MITFVSEGLNDAIFVSAILEHYFDVKIEENKNMIVDKPHLLTVKRGVNVLKNYLTTKHYFLNIKKTFCGLMVYGNNGKKTVINHVIPTLVFDIIERLPQPEILKLFVLLDSKIKCNEIQRIQHILKEKLRNNLSWQSRYVITCSGKNEIKIEPTSDPRYSIIVKVYLIPLSLEDQLVKKAKTIYKNRVKFCESNVHRMLEKIAEEIDLPKTEFIKKSVYEKWFINEYWYTRLLEEIKRFCEFKDT